MNTKILRIVVVAILAVTSCHAPTLAEGPTPTPAWQRATSAEVGMDKTRLDQARGYALTGKGAGIVVRHGKIVLEWGDTSHRYDLKSSTKSIGGTALGLALMDQKVKLSDLAQQHHPNFGTPPEENVATGWLGEITLQHLATQTAGFDKPGGYEKLLFRPGTEWHYSDGGPNWLAECLTIQYGRDLRDLLFERVFTPIGITDQDLTWRENSYRPAEIKGIPRREFGSGISANVDAMARIGLLYLHDGRWNSQQLLPRSFVQLVQKPLPEVVDLPVFTSDYGEKLGDASSHYGLLWWNNADATLKGVPRDAYWTWGLYDSLIVVIPSLDIVIARAGKSFEQNRTDHYSVLRPFIEPIAQSVVDARKTLSEQSFAGAPYPPSKVITDIIWAPKESIVRMADGSDNWPMTWADDGHQYTAYGDGRGFDEAAPKKLSLGLAKVVGSARNFRGTNIVSPAGETVGDGSHGAKASGMLMVEGTLFMWVRNTGNSQLRWSDDHGVTWQQADWKFTTSFGCPTFLNFGQNYADARDDFVYLFSHDNSSAYEPADRMVAARVPKDRLADRKAYQFFERIDSAGKPLWTDNIDRRGAIFNFPQNCYRNGITYNAGLKRYLWCQVFPPVEGTAGPRFEGGFGIYDAPEPWGPWTTVYFTELWDVGPGETSSFPTKWMSSDGKKIHLVFSGEDHFSVRAATLTVQEDSQTFGKARHLNPRLVEMPANRWLMLHQQKPADQIRFSRQEHGGSCFDTKRGRLILFGSNTHGKNWYNSPFVFDPAEETWSQLHPHDPRSTYAVDKSGVGVAGPRGDHPWAMHAFGALLYDAARDEMVLASYPGHMIPGRFTDSVEKLWPEVKKFPTWTFDLEREQWKPLACDAVSFFPFCAAYDSHLQVILGHKPEGIFQLGGTPRTWEQRTSQVFHDGWHTNAVYDSGEQALIIFGTSNNSNTIEVFHPATGEHRLMPTVGRRPPKDQHNPMAYVPELAQTVVVVDRTIELDDHKSQQVAEVWLYNLSTDAWTPIPEATLPFACGMNYHMQYDPFHKCLLLVTGGHTPEIGPPTGETTVWALRIVLP